MDNIKKELLKNYIKANIAPILVDFIEGKAIPNSVLLPSTCKVSELNGYYIDNKYLPPKWVEELEKNKEYLLKERYEGKFSRTFYVGNVDKTNIKAKVEDGILSITLPKQELKQEKMQIEIN